MSDDLNDVCRCSHGKSRHVMLMLDGKKSYHHCHDCTTCETYREYDDTEKRYVSR